MFTPLTVMLGRRRVFVAPMPRADEGVSANAIVGIRGDKLGVGATLRSPSMIERRLSHMRLAKRTLRAYTFVEAKPAFARPAPSQDAQFAAPPPATSGVVGLRQASPLGVPINVSGMVRTTVKPEHKDAIVFQAGDEPAALLTAAGMDHEQAQAAASLLLDGLAKSGGPEAGDVIELTHPADLSEEAQPVRVAIERGSRLVGAVALDDRGTYEPVAEADEAPVATEAAGTLADFSGSGAGNGLSLRNGLYALMDEKGLDRRLADTIVRICSHDVDLGAPAGWTDTISFLFAPGDASDDDDPELAYVAIKAGGKEHRFYRFPADEDADADYYDDQGRSASTMLLRKPVASGRLGDGFGWRIHPVLKDRRFHQGVDYAAPYGSPIVAAGAGVVEKIDEQWGYGKYIRIRHDQGYETTYAHNSGYPATIRVGTRVRQGQTIAFIGSTGLSTGPHLYYELRINGRNVDPLRVRLAAGAILHGSVLQAFLTRRARVDTLVHDAAAGGGLEVASKP